MTAIASAPLYAGCAALSLAGAALILLLGRGRTAWLLGAVCAANALWAGSVAALPDDPLGGTAGALEAARVALWIALLLHLAHRAGQPGRGPLARRFALAAGVLIPLALLSGLPGAAAALSVPTLGSPTLLLRLALGFLVVMVAENLFRNAGEAARWHVNLPCVALGGLGVFDVLLYADAALSREFAPALIDARAALAALIVPLLAIAAGRDRRWRRDTPVSREAVFHGATLMVGGAFLLGVGAAGEALRHLAGAAGGEAWGRTAQVSLLAGAAMALAVALTSRSTRSRLRRGFVDHFFTERYDYRREWMRCLSILSAPQDEAAASIRAIRAVAEAVDSPAGVLLEAEPDGWRWSGSWNLPRAPLGLPPGHALPAALRGSEPIAFGTAHPLPAELAPFGPLWLAVPLSHPREGVIGAVLLAPPRAPFALDREVFDLLRAIGLEAGLFLAERAAAERLADARRLGDYARRFAFVAHDVKTVSSQLSLLLANAEENLHDPEFQADMLLTVRAAAGRIDTLIARLRQPEGGGTEPAAADAVTDPLARLRALAGGRAVPVRVEAEGAPPGPVAMPAEAFDAAIGHLLNNAAEASPPGTAVTVRVRGGGDRLTIDIVDQGGGMTPDYVRDELFRPLRTSKAGGSGIGAWQARELLRESGGELTVLSRPGAGTTMRIGLPVDIAAAARPAAAMRPAPHPDGAVHA